jgi:ABC-type transport system substrate-binding protein
MEQGNFQMDGSTGWAMDYPDPEDFYMVFYSKNFPREGANYARYSNPEYDKLYEQMAAMDDGPERLAIIHKMNDILAEDCPAIWEFDKKFFIATQPWGRWTHNTPILEYGFNKYHHVDPVLREKLRAQWNRKPVWPPIALGALILAGAIYALRWNRRKHV